MHRHADAADGAGEAREKEARFDAAAIVTMSQAFGARSSGLQVMVSSEAGGANEANGSMGLWLLGPWVLGAIDKRAGERNK